MWKTAENWTESCNLTFVAVILVLKGQDFLQIVGKSKNAAMHIICCEKVKCWSKTDTIFGISTSKIRNKTWILFSKHEVGRCNQFLQSIIVKCVFEVPIDQKMLPCIPPLILFFLRHQHLCVLATLNSSTDGKQKWQHFWCQSCYEVEMSVQFAVSKKEKTTLLWSVKFFFVKCKWLQIQIYCRPIWTCV